MNILVCKSLALLATGFLTENIFLNFYDENGSVEEIISTAVNICPITLIVHKEEILKMNAEFPSPLRIL